VEPVEDRITGVTVRPCIRIDSNTTRLNRATDRSARPRQCGSGHTPYSRTSRRPDSKKGERDFLISVSLETDQPHRSCNRSDDQQNEARGKRFSPPKRRQYSAHQYPAEKHEACHHGDPLDLLGEVMHLALERVASVRMANTKRRDKDAEKTVALVNSHTP